VSSRSLVRRPKAFSHPDWIFEIKHDGFRALAYLDGSEARLVSRNGNTFKTFLPDLCAGLAAAITRRKVVLDGEIVCSDKYGCSQFQ